MGGDYCKSFHQTQPGLQQEGSRSEHSLPDAWHSAGAGRGDVLLNSIAYKAYKRPVSFSVRQKRIRGVLSGVLAILCLRFQGGDLRLELGSSLGVTDLEGTAQRFCQAI